MTQKELLYVEDAIKHECNVISIIKDIIERLENDDLVDFMEDMLESHKSMKDNLMNLMEDNIND